MINNYSYLDGLKVIMGNIPINIAALIVLIAYGRPPDCYVDEDRKEKANHIFAQLIIGHVLFTIFSVRNIFYDSKKDVELQVILVFYAVLIAIQLCHYWYFYEEQMIELKKTEEQRTFFLVLALELFTML